MTIQNSICTSFKQNILAPILTTNTYVALYLSTANIGAATTAYTTVGEVVGGGYVAGGISLPNPVVWTDGTTVGFSWENVTFPAMTLPDIGGALFYNHDTGHSISTVIFTPTRFVIGQGLQIIFPINTAQNGMNRFMGQ